MKRRIAAVGLGLLLVLAGCDPGSPPGPARPAAPSFAVPSSLHRAFTAGPATDGSGPALETRHIGRIQLPSGRLLACDPFVCEKARPFARPVPAGEFPVDLAVLDPKGDARVAFARIAFSMEPVVSWEPALVEGEDPARLRDGGVFGYGVDTGTGAFMDLQAWRDYGGRMEREPDAFRHFLFSELDRSASGGLMTLVLPVGPGAVALFPSGEGDGGYVSYWGHDRHGRLALIVTDFQVMPEVPLP